MMGGPPVCASPLQNPAKPPTPAAMERRSSPLYRQPDTSSINSANTNAEMIQRVAGFPGYLGHDLCRDRFDLLIGQGFFPRLQRHRDGDGFLVVVDALALVDVEHGDARDQLPVGALSGAHDIAGLDAAVDDKRK